MMSLLKRRDSSVSSEAVQLREIEERHHLAVQVFKRREQCGFSQDVLASAAGMTQPQIALIEAGESNPTLRSLVRISFALGCSVSDLLASWVQGPAENVEAQRSRVRDWKTQLHLLGLARSQEESPQSDLFPTSPQTRTPRAWAPLGGGGAEVEISHSGDTLIWDLRRP